jgi:hypothetical protein
MFTGFHPYIGLQNQVTLRTSGFIGVNDDHDTIIVSIKRFTEH